MRIPENLPMDATAPLLCAGVTVFIPMKDSNLVESPGKKIGIVGLGGLGHVAVKFGKAFGHHVTVISTSPSKEQEAKDRLGADDFIVSTNAKQMKVCCALPLFQPKIIVPTFCTHKLDKWYFKSLILPKEVLIKNSDCQELFHHFF